MPDGWEWDSTLFQGSAAYYERGRLPYAPGFAPHLFGDRLADFERDLRAVLRQTSADDHFAERLPATEIMIWHRPHGER